MVPNRHPECVYGSRSNLMLRRFIALCALVALSSQVACYNTYNITLDELSKAQEGGGTNAVTMKTSENEEIVVTENSKIGVTDKQGTFHAVSPFNFTLTAGQLVAPDEDKILAREQIETGNVKQISSTKTALVVAVGVLAAAGLGAFVVLTAPEKKGFGASQ
jgi:hypothetical protein